jgi:uncharacterized membrane protein
MVLVLVVSRATFTLHLSALSLDPLETNTPHRSGGLSTAATVGCMVEGAMWRRNLPRGKHSGRSAGVAFVFLWFAIGGAAHFLATDVEVRIVPPYLPWHRTIVLVSGFFELAGAAALLHGSSRRAAGIGLFALTVLVTPANVYMLQRPDLFGIPTWILIARLPLQAGLLVLIWWSTIERD